METATDQSRFVSPPRFESEATFLQTVAELLDRIPGIFEVEILHGRQEYGKDIVFSTPSPLGDSLCCACVVKNTKISGTVEGSSGARTVLLQAEQALDTPFVDRRGEERQIHYVYILTPETITQEAMASIRGKLKARGGQISFIPGAHFFRLLRTYWSTYFRDEYALLEASVRPLAAQGLTGDLREAAESYGLRPPDDFEKTVYVPRTLSSTIATFDVGSLDKPLPQHGGKDGKEGAAWISSLRRLETCLPHLAKWGLAKTDVGSGMSQLRTMLADVALGVEKEFRSQREEEALTAHAGGRGGRSSPLSKRNPRLVLMAEAACDMAHECIGPLHHANSMASVIVESQGADLLTLLSGAALSAKNLTQCLAAAPLSLVSLATSRTLRVSEGEIRGSQASWFVVGPAGFGKTSFCRWNALLDAEAFRTGGAKVFPVYVPLNILARRELTSFEDAFLGVAGQSSILSGDLIETGREKGFRLRVYLDGLDEVASPNVRRRIVQLGREAHDAGLQIVMTSRDYIRTRDLEWIARIDLDMLERDVQEVLAEQVLGSSEGRREFLGQLDQSTSLREIFGVPLMARLILLVFKETREIPENRARLYRTFVELLSGGWDLAKGVVRDSRFGRVIKCNVLCKLAHTVHEEGQRIFTIATVHRAAVACAGGLANDEFIALCRELVRDGLLSHSANTFYFSHLSFQEYLCAAYYKGCPQADGVDAALGRFLSGNDWWREVVAFYIGLSESPDSVARWLHEKYIEDGQRSTTVFGFFQESFPRYKLTLSPDQPVRWLD